MPIWIYPAIILAGFFCGLVNTLAGSGSLITLPLLIFLGLPANVANGTNRVGILLQNVVGVHSFHRQKVLDFQRGKWLLAPAVLGAIVGAWIATDLNERVMRLFIGCIMVVMLFVLLFKPERWLKGAPTPEAVGSPIANGLMFFAVGLYGGFIQVGVGIFLLAALVLVSGYDLVRANALKVLIVLGFTPLALLVFALNGQVNWTLGLILSLGNMMGAWAGARMTVKGGAVFVRWVLIAVVAASALKLFWDFLTTG